MSYCRAKKRDILDVGCLGIQSRRNSPGNCMKCYRGDYTRNNIDFYNKGDSPETIEKCLACIRRSCYLDKEKVSACPIVDGNEMTQKKELNLVHN